MPLRELLRSADRQIGIRNRLRGLPASGFDLNGEKELDWGWCLAHLPRSPLQRVLDIGCVQAPIVPAAVALGHEVVGVDTDQIRYQLPGFTFLEGDFLDRDFGPDRFDVIVLCSVLEHIGLVGRYRQADVPDGDLRAMRKVRALLEARGRLILTVPVGKEMVFAPWHRIYGASRLAALLDGFQIEEERFFEKEAYGPWRVCERERAFQVDRNGLSYALGQFLLRLR